MTDEPVTEQTPALTGERVGPGVYVTRKANGAEVRTGPEGTPGAFTPGELLRIAVAACAAQSAEHLLAHRLGADFTATFTTTAVKGVADNRYLSILTELATDLSGLTPERRDHLIERSLKAIDRQCTVGRTLEAGADTEKRIVDAAG